jgi:uncharacterized membrane protein (UPF0182 family)
MKDIRLSVKRQRKELAVLSGCLLIAFAMNVYSILVYQTAWKELYTQLHWVLAIGFILYFALLLIRLLYACLFRKLIMKGFFKKK